MPADFTVGFVCHGELPLVERTLPQSLAALCGATSRSYDTILVVDGRETADVAAFLDLAERSGVDEVRLRSRARNCAGADPSNNGHLHLFSDKTRFLVTLEGDVAAFSVEAGVDMLDRLARLFDAEPELAVATRLDDHDSWVWRLEPREPHFRVGLRSVNRLASHFVVYETRRARPVLEAAGVLRAEAFEEDERGHGNYEDLLSHAFARPAGPGIGWLDDLPLRVWHCDEKLAPGSLQYRRDLGGKLAIFDRRAAEARSRSA
jgi:hypothetical protein